MTTQASLHEQIAEFVRNVVTAMGVTVTVTSEVNADGIRVDISGEEGELLVRRKGEALDALQHLVNSIWRDQSGRDGRIVVDCLDFRKGKDAELRQMARFMIEKAKMTRSAAGDGAAQFVLAAPRAPRSLAGSGCRVREPGRRPREDDHHLAALTAQGRMVPVRDTLIVALATPPGRGALALVRLSGAGAIELVAGTRGAARVSSPGRDARAVAAA